MEKFGTKAQLNPPSPCGAALCPKWGETLVEGPRGCSSGDALSSFDEALVVEAALFQATMNLVSSYLGHGSFSSTPFFGAHVREARHDVG